MTIETRARKLIGDVAFERIAKNAGKESAIRAAMHRMLADQHQERVFWGLPVSQAITRDG
jgi:ABC-type uncharacterized transport system YnjBCD substrate-binding protein